MNNINKEWHQKNKMPKNPTLEERIQWHKEHLKYCDCRKDIPKSLEMYFPKSSQQS